MINTKVFMSLLFCVFVLPGVSNAAGTRGYSEDLYGDLNIRHQQQKKPDDMYMGIRGELSFLNWKNEYKDESDAKLGSDSFDFKPVVGIDIFVGYQFVEKWRVDLEFGYLGKYSETETEYWENPGTEKYRFDLETYYLMANGYRDFQNGLYVGLGAGGAFVKTLIDSTEVAGEKSTKFSPMGALMFGWSHELDDKVTFDLRYRFAVFHGGNLDIDAGAGRKVKTEIGFIKDNSFSAGIRYSF